MPSVPQVETYNKLTIDVADNADLREIFSHKETGDKCKLTMHLQVMSKTPETVTLAIEKIVTDPSDYYKDEVEPKINEPIMATMHRSRAKHKDSMGPHGRPPQTAENSQEPWMKAYT